jgi:hypothetical protein
MNYEKNKDYMENTNLIHGINSDYLKKGKNSVCETNNDYRWNKNWIVDQSKTTEGTKIMPPKN